MTSSSGTTTPKSTPAPTTSPPPYEFPARTEQNLSDWQRKMDKGFADQEFVWTKDIDRQWILSWTCPRCDHATTQFFDFEVIAAHTFGEDFFEVSKGKKTFSDQVVCLCDPELPHRKDTEGCGAGSGLEINIPCPPEEA